MGARGSQRASQFQLIPIIWDTQDINGIKSTGDTTVSADSVLETYVNCVALTIARALLSETLVATAKTTSLREPLIPDVAPSTNQHCTYQT